MRNLVILLLLVASIMSCQQDSNDPIPLDPVPLDTLETTGILGRWEIASEETIGGISDMLPRCCRFLEFTPDNNISDYKGFLTYTASLVNSGTFEVNIANQTVLFIDDDDDEFTFEFSVDASRKNLRIDYTENGADITQGWVKVD